MFGILRCLCVCVGSSLDGGCRSAFNTPMESLMTQSCFRVQILFFELALLHLLSIQNNGHLYFHAFFFSSHCHAFAFQAALMFTFLPIHLSRILGCLTSHKPDQNPHKRHVFSAPALSMSQSDSPKFAMSCIALSQNTGLLCFLCVIFLLPIIIISYVMLPFLVVSLPICHLSMGRHHHNKQVTVHWI